MFKNLNKYFSKNPFFNALAHMSVGLGVGILLTHSYFDPHPLRFGLLFLGIGVLAHLYAMRAK